MSLLLMEQDADFLKLTNEIFTRQPTSAMLQNFGAVPAAATGAGPASTRRLLLIRIFFALFQNV